VQFLIYAQVFACPATMMTKTTAAMVAEGARVARPPSATRGARLWGSTERCGCQGRHAVEAALTNPNRTAKKLWGTREAIQEMLDDHDAELPRDLPVEYAQAVDLARLVARDAPHQGLVLECLPLDDVALDDVLDEAEGRTLVLLDQVTDPHNVGAICAVAPRSTWPR
jgi:tRNA G18 (ribose-2'-O)-methylase SpoU